MFISPHIVGAKWYFAEKSLLRMVHNGPVAMGWIVKKKKKKGYRNQNQEIRKPSMKEGREGATEGRTWGKELELCYSPWKSTQLLRASVVLPVKQEWWKYDFLTDTWIVDLSVPCEVYNMMQSMAFYLASFAIISPIYAFCAINIHLIKTVDSFKR